MKKKIYSAIRACTKIGLDLSDYDLGFSHHNGKWVPKGPWVHPLVAVILVDQPSVIFDLSEEEIIYQHFQNKYNKTEDWIRSFCWGLTRTIAPIDNPYKLGSKIRKEFKLWNIR